MLLVTKKSECKIHREVCVKSPKEIKKSVVKKRDANGHISKPFRYSLASIESFIFGRAPFTYDFMKN
jgi:hypothetical protein